MHYADGYHHLSTRQIQYVLAKPPLVDILGLFYVVVTTIDNNLAIDR